MAFVSKDKRSPSSLCDQRSIGYEMKFLNVHIEGVMVCFMVRAVAQVAQVKGRAAVEECRAIVE
jgi:hypothetical protein